MPLALTEKARAATENASTESLGKPLNEAAIHIATAARQLNDLRENWLNPPQWVDWVSTPEEDAAGFPKRPVAKPGHADALKKRTLTNLYNTRPSWLTQAHAALDQAVALAYGWADYSPALPDDTLLRRLLALNLSRQPAPAKPSNF